MRRRLLLTFILGCIALTPAFIQAQENMVIGPLEYPEGISPLTGLPVLYPEALERRPLTIKITNWPPEVRPQSGLNSADIVWEHLVEGGVTRFTGVFYSEPVPHVGPVRSARLVDIELTRAYGSLFVHSGSSRGTLERLRDDAVMPTRNFGGGPCPPLCRFPQDGLAYEHTLYADTEALYERAGEIGLDTISDSIKGMAFGQDVPPNGRPVDGIHIAYRQTEIEWAYDAFGGVWLRSQDDVAHYDAYSGSQVRTENVLVLEADHIEQPIVADGYWGAANYAFEVNLTGSGRVYLFRDGHYFEGEWRREDDDAPLMFYDLQGDVLPFKPGHTFINLVPRWQNGYELTFLLAEPLQATIAGGSVILRSGPGEGYQQAGSAAQGDVLTLVGRNQSGSWLQVLSTRGDVMWIAASLVTVHGGEIQWLPNSRSTFEG